MVKYSLPLFLNTFWTFAPWLFDVVRNIVRRAPQRFVNLNHDGKPILETLPVSQLLGRRSTFGADVYRVRARRTTELRGPPPDECTRTTYSSSWVLGHHDAQLRGAAMSPCGHKHWPIHSAAPQSRTPSQSEDAVAARQLCGVT